jgi:hypothetical protein
MAPTWYDCFAAAASDIRARLLVRNLPIVSYEPPSLIFIGSPSKALTTSLTVFYVPSLSTARWLNLTETKHPRAIATGSDPCYLLA